MTIRVKSTDNLKAGVATGGGSVPGWSASQNSVAKQLMMYYLQGGLSKAGAAGMIGNQMQESALNPGEAGGYLSQWGGARLTSLKSYAAQMGQPVTSIEAQAKFTLQELKSSYPALYQSLQTATDPAKAAVAISNQFERPAAWAANNSNRAQYAISAYNYLSGASSPVGNNSGPSSPSSLLDLLTAPVEAIGGWLASVAINLIKDTAEGIADVIIIPAVHWQQRSVMVYYSAMFGKEAWPMIPWTAVFWGFGYGLLFVDPNSGNLKPAPVRNSLLGHHVRALQAVPAKRELIKPRDVESKTPKKPQPIKSSAEVTQVRTLKTQRPQPVRITENGGRISDTESPESSTTSSVEAEPQGVTNKEHRTGTSSLPNRRHYSERSTGKGSGGRRPPRRGGTSS